MSICKLDIKKAIIDKAGQMISEKGAEVSVDVGYFRNPNIASKAIQEVNREFRDVVIKEGEKGSFSIIPSDSIIKKYYYTIDEKDRFTTSNMFSEDENYEYWEERDEYGDVVNTEKRPKNPDQMFSDDTTTSKSNKATISFIKDLLDKMGVNIKDTTMIISEDGKQMLSANGLADFTKNIIEIIRGKEDVALTEEAMHFVVRIVKQTNPALYKKLLGEINGYKVYNRIHNRYKDIYVDAQGRPNIAKIKEEAITKILTEHIIKQLEDDVEKPENLVKVKSWWKEIIDWIKNLFYKADFDPFSELADQVISGEFKGKAEDISEHDTLYQLGTHPDPEEVFKTIKTFDQKLSKVKKIIDGQEKEIYVYEGVKELYKRITDRAKSFYDKKFKDKALNKSEFQQAMDDFKQETGLAGHADAEDILNRYVDNTTGLLRETPLPQNTPSKIDPENNQVYNQLESYISQLLSDLTEKHKAEGPVRFIAEMKGANLVKNEGGTMDLVYILPNGKVGVLDWKFISLDTSRYDDIPWFKINAWNIQMDGYRDMLKSYGISESQLDKTRMIPIVSKYFYDKETKKMKLKGISIGSVDPKNESNDFLLPVSSRRETTSNKQLDRLITKLYGLYDLKSNARVANEQKFVKAAELNQLFHAIRQLQMKENISPLVDQGMALVARLDESLAQLESVDPGKDLAVYEKVLGDLQDILASLDLYQNIDTELKSVVDQSTEDGKELYKEVSELSSRARQAKLKGNDVIFSLVDQIAELKNLDAVSAPEREVKNWYKQYMRSFSKASTVGTQLFYKLMAPILGRISIETQERIEELSDIKKRVLELAAARGIKPTEVYSLIARGDKHQLVSEFGKEYYDAFKKAVAEKDKEWFIKNIRMDEYMKWFEEAKDAKFKQLESMKFSENEEVNTARIDREKRKFLQEFDISNDSAYGNWKMRQYGEAKWQNPAYKEIFKKGNEPLADLYNYIQKRNKEVVELGVFQEFARHAKTFLPFIRKDIVDKIIFGGKLRLGENILKQITVDEEMDKFGDRDPLTGKLRNRIPFYFTRELDNKDEVSTDIFEILALYDSQIVNYKNKQEVENITNALLYVEKNKGHLDTNKFGEIADEDLALEGNENNAKILEDFVKNVLYGQRYTNMDESDQKIGKIGSKVAQKVNDITGQKIFSEETIDKMENSPVSATKSISSLNRWFQLKTLALALPISISNYVGGKMQSYLNSGRFFTKADLRAADLSTAALVSDTMASKKYLALMNYFDALLNKDLNEKVKHLSLNKFTQHAVADLLMSMQKYGDRAVEAPLFLAFVDNAAIINNEIVNIREYVKKNNPNWEQRHLLSKAERKKLNAEIEAEIEKLKKSPDALMNRVKIDEKTGRAEIENFDRKSDSAINFRNQFQNIVKDVTGNTGIHDPKRANMNLLMDSFMIFKNWIPRLAEKRVGELMYNAGTDSWDYGRARIFFKILGSNALGSISGLYNIYMGNPQGAKIIERLYEQKRIDYRKRTGKDLKMSEADFADMVQEAIHTETQELLMVLAMMSMFIWAAGAAGDDDDPETKGFYTWTARTIDRVRDELAFFYSPTSFLQIFNGSVLPSLGVLKDTWGVVTSLGEEGFGFAGTQIGATDWGEKHMKSAKPLKYIFKAAPITKEMLTYIALFNNDLANEMGIKLTTESRSNR